MLSLAHAKRAIMTDQDYWLRRKRASVSKANAATSARARLAHFDLAGRYSVKAADAGEGDPLDASVPEEDPSDDQ